MYAQEKLCVLVEGSSLLGEEGEQEKKEGLVWIVDPIDGAVNFSRAIDEYAISVALLPNDYQSFVLPYEITLI